MNIIAQNLIDGIATHGLDPARCLLWMTPSTLACNLRMYPHFVQNLLAWREWELGDPPLMVEHAQIAVADAAVFNGDVDLLAAHGARILFKGFQLSTGLKRGEGCYHHASSSFNF